MTERQVALLGSIGLLCIELAKFDNDCDVILCSKCNEYRFSWNERFIMYRTNAAYDSAICVNSLQVIRLKMRLLQHLPPSHSFLKEFP